jgi:hypothetical protein
MGMMVICRKFGFVFFVLPVTIIVLIIALAVTPAYPSRLPAWGEEGWVGETRKILAEMAAPGENTEQGIRS